MAMLILTCKCGQQMKVPVSAVFEVRTCVGCGEPLKITLRNTSPCAASPTDLKEEVEEQRPATAASGAKRAEPPQKEELRLAKDSVPAEANAKRLKATKKKGLQSPSLSSQNHVEPLLQVEQTTKRKPAKPEPVIPLSEFLSQHRSCFPQKEFHLRTDIEKNKRLTKKLAAELDRIIAHYARGISFFEDGIRVGDDLIHFDTIETIVYELRPDDPNTLRIGGVGVGAEFKLNDKRLSILPGEFCRDFAEYLSSRTGARYNLGELRHDRENDSGFDANLTELLSRWKPALTRVLKKRSLSKADKRPVTLEDITAQGFRGIPWREIAYAETYSENNWLTRMTNSLDRNPSDVIGVLSTKGRLLSIACSKKALFVVGGFLQEVAGLTRPSARKKTGAPMTLVASGKSASLRTALTSMAIGISLLTVVAVVGPEDTLGQGSFAIGSCALVYGAYMLLRHFF
jgi:hypothetical protein